MKNKDVIVTVTGACGHTWKSDHAAILAGTWDVCPICELKEAQRSRTESSQCRRLQLDS